jgi:hypothetical protein
MEPRRAQRIDRSSRRSRNVEDGLLLAPDVWEAVCLAWRFHLFGEATVNLEGGAVILSLAARQAPGTSHRPGPFSNSREFQQLPKREFPLQVSH